MKKFKYNSIDYLNEIRRYCNSTEPFLVTGQELREWCEQFEEEFYSLYPHREDRKELKNPVDKK